MRLPLLFFFTLLISFHYAQRMDIDTSKMIQLSGVVVSEGELTPMPYITVYDKSIRKGVFADYYGFFSLVSGILEFTVVDVSNFEVEVEIDENVQLIEVYYFNLHGNREINNFQYFAGFFRYVR